MVVACYFNDWFMRIECVDPTFQVFILPYDDLN